MGKPTAAELEKDLRRGYRLDGEKDGPIWVENAWQDDFDVYESCRKSPHKAGSDLINNALEEIGSRLEKEIPEQINPSELAVYKTDKPRFLAAALDAYSTGLRSGAITAIQQAIERAQEGDPDLE